MCGSVRTPQDVASMRLRNERTHGVDAFARYLGRRPLPKNGIGRLRRHADSPSQPYKVSFRDLPGPRFSALTAGVDTWASA